MTDEDIRKRNRAAVEAALAAVSDGDVDRQLEQCSDDFVLEFPFAEPSKRVEGKAVVREYLGAALALFAIRIRLDSIYACTDPDTLVVEYSSEGTVPSTGREYANRYITVFMFRDGKIRLQREYYNPVPAMRALASG